MLDDTVLDKTLPALIHAPRWFLGFSGGMDSTALLQLLVDWSRRHTGAPVLTAIHINHQLQGEADSWQAGCEAACEELRVSCIARRVVVDASDGSEEGARRARYAAFGDIIGPGDVLFLAHHLDDQVETFFLRLMRGAGLEGLAAIPASRSLADAQLVRPLLGVSRDEIHRYVQSRSLAFVEDPSNADVTPDRNFLRSEILPLLATRWPGYRTTVTRAAAHVADASRALEHAAPEIPEVSSVTGDPGLVLTALLQGTQAEVARALRSWLRGQGCQAPDQAALGEFLRQLRSAGQDTSPQLRTARYALARFGDGVYLMPRFAAAPGAETQVIMPGERHRVPGVGTVFLERVDEYAEEGFSLHPEDVPQLRWRTGGERCRVAGRAGGTTLKKFLQEVGVPPWWRDRVPLLYLDLEMLAVGDLTLCESSRLGTGGEIGQTRWCLRWEREKPPFD